MGLPCFLHISLRTQLEKTSKRRCNFRCDDMSDRLFRQKDEPG
jgi:hypothetical protein